MKWFHLNDTFNTGWCFQFANNEILMDLIHFVSKTQKNENKNEQKNEMTAWDSNFH